MPARRKSRQRALQILYLWDARRQPVEEATAAYYDTLYSEESRTKPLPDAFVDLLVTGAVEHVEELDRRITQHAEHWRIERMPSVDRLSLIHISPAARLRRLAGCAKLRKKNRRGPECRSGSIDTYGRHWPDNSGVRHVL